MHTVYPKKKKRPQFYQQSLPTSKKESFSATIKMFKSQLGNTYL